MQLVTMSALGTPLLSLPGRELHVTRELQAVREQGGSQACVGKFAVVVTYPERAQMPVHRRKQGLKLPMKLIAVTPGIV